MEFTSLLSPVKIGKMEVKNRFVVPPMGTNYADEDGGVTQQLIDYYTARAKGGFGLIIVEFTAVDRGGKASKRQTAIWDDSLIPGWKKLVDSVHAAGAKIILQIHHGGRQSAPSDLPDKQPVAPSAVACPLSGNIPRALTTQECWDLVEKFGDAAVRAKKAGFDGVEVHGGHGYLIAQFMSTHANKRYDEFGGDFMGRMKFPLEVFKNVRKKCGDDYPMTFRYSYDEKVNGGRTIEESTVVARLAEEAGVDALNITIMTFASRQYMSAPAAMPPGFNQHPTSLITDTVNIPVITVGRFNNMHMAEDVVRSGRADMIALGRESMADPEIPLKVLENRVHEISPCIACLQSCLGYRSNPDRVKASCLVNPVMGFEGEYDFSPAKQKKKVLIAGGGPAGLMAAWNAARRGHQVIVCEKSGDMGGQFRLAAVPPTKHELLAMLKYYLTMGKKYGVEYRLGTEVTTDLIESEKPDAIILATGGVPLIPNIPGIDGDNIVTCIDVLAGAVKPGKKVLVIGGGMSGAETADLLAEQGRNVTIVEMRDAIATDVESGLRYFLMQRLESADVKMMTGTKVLAFLPDGIEYEQGGEKKALIGFDTIVLAMGARSHNPLAEEVKGLVEEVYVVGDARQVNPANAATEDGLAAALKL